MKLQLGGKTLVAPKLWLHVREAGFDDETPPVAEPTLPAGPTQPDSQGFLIRSLRVTGEQPTLRWAEDHLRYTPLQYQRYYIDMRQSFDEYKNKFSSKTRSTISRKIKKYAEYCGGEVSWKIYRTPDDMPEFFRLARSVSETTYQEKLLDAGLPNSEKFLGEMKRLAQEGNVRGFILFHQDQPVSYLYCPVVNNVLIYAFLGYRPDYMGHSVGTVLQWLALESLFKEQSFRFFDFTEGESEHKKLFATDSVRCANVYFLRKNLRNIFLLYTHRAVNNFGEAIGSTLNQLGLKAKARKLLRFG